VPTPPQMIFLPRHAALLSCASCVCVACVCTIDFNTIFMIKCKEGIPRRRIPYACVFSYY
jgi:hypothetical protein